MVRPSGPALARSHRGPRRQPVGVVGATPTQPSPPAGPASSPVAISTASPMAALRRSARYRERLRGAGSIARQRHRAHRPIGIANFVDEEGSPLRRRPGRLPACSPASWRPSAPTAHRMTTARRGPMPSPPRARRRRDRCRPRDRPAHRHLSRTARRAGQGARASRRPGCDRHRHLATRPLADRPAGEANHAGTTTMADRHDAMLTLAGVVQAARTAALSPRLRRHHRQVRPTPGESTPYRAMRPPGWTRVARTRTRSAASSPTWPHSRRQPEEVTESRGPRSPLHAAPGEPPARGARRLTRWGRARVTTPACLLRRAYRAGILLSAIPPVFCIRPPSGPPTRVAAGVTALGTALTDLSQGGVMIAIWARHARLPEGTVPKVRIEIEGRANHRDHLAV